jgi:hypothetical protein
MNILEICYGQVLEACYDRVMEKHFAVHKGVGLTEAESKEEFFGFKASEVEMVHHWKMGAGSGVYFRLRDGRVVDTSAQEHDPNPFWYDQTTH